MRKFRTFMHSRFGKTVTAFTIVAAVHAASAPWNYLSALEVERAKESQIREIARKMKVDPEFLLNPGGKRSFEFAALFAALSEKLGFSAPAVVAANDQPEDVKAQIARVKAAYALVAADTTLAKLAQLLDVSLSPESVRTKKKGQIKAELQSVLRLVERDFLPPLMDGLPGAAASRDAQMRQAVNRLRQEVKDVINAPHALDEKNIDATLVRLRETIGGSLKVKGGGQPRWTRDPFPVKDAYKQATRVTAAGRYGQDGGAAASDATTPAVVTNAMAPAASTAVASTAVASDVAALAAQLGTPARAFRYVYDNIGFEPYGGVAKGARGALLERRGNDWDQALLLRDLLQAQGYQAQLEWGKVDLPVARAMNLVGTEDPTQAANLLATAGYDAVALTQNGSPIVIRLTHAWVRAFIPYMPNRGTTAGTPDTWVRMDPSFKRYEYQAGIDVDVPWNESEYLQTSAVRPPTDFYADKVWSYIRANNLNCNNLAQVAKSGRVRAANFPFVPATLNARVEQLVGLAAQPPASMMQTVSLSIADPYYGEVLVSYSGTFADLWGKKLSITFPPATAEDAATIARYGGIYNTPAYLVRLKAVISIDDQPVAQGGSVTPGADLSLDLSFREPYLGTDAAHHEITAGETMTEVFDSGRTPDALIAERMERLKAIAAQPPSDAQREAMLTEKLNLVGLRYFQEVDDGFDFAAGTRWHRWVKSTFEGLVSQRVNVTYNFVGQAVRITPSDRNIDVTRLAVGIIPINSDLSERLNTMALAGLHTSYLEGSIWEEMEAQQGISATKALLLARMAGQTIRTADRGNVEAVLAATNLSSAVESNIRGAVAQGRIAIVPSANIRLNKWVGTGYILRDPIGGSATYPISGGFAGGSSTGAGTSGTSDTLGTESHLSEFDQIFDQLLADSGLATGTRPPGPVTTPSTMYSDPVNVSTGNMYRSFTDLAIVALQPVSIDRTYNSRSTYNGPFGYGWTSFLDERIVVQPDGSAVWRQMDGTEHRFARNADGTFATPAGLRWTLAMTAAGATLTSVEGFVRTYDAAGRIARNVDPQGNDVSYTRDAAGNVQTLVDASGRSLMTFTVTDGKITQVRDLTGRTLTYAYDGENLVAYTDATGRTWTYRYDLQHNLTEVVDPLGNRQAYDYDADDRIMRHTDAVGAEEFFHYDIAGRTTVVTDKRGGDRMFRYDSEGRATAEVDPAGNMATATWDAASNRTSYTNSRGFTYTHTYDAAGNRTSTARPDGTVESTTWDERGRPLVVRDAAGGVTNNTYDAAGNLVEASRTVGGTTMVTRHTYDSRGRVLTTTDPNGHVTKQTYDDNGAVLSRTDAAGNTITFKVDALGRAVEATDAAGNKTTFAYDAKDRRVAMRDPYGRESAIAYDGAGRITSTTSGGVTTTYAWDGEGRLLATRDALGFEKKTTYNAAGDVVTVQDRRGGITRYEYDPVGRVRKKVDPNGAVWSYDWCAAIAGGASSGCSSCSRGGDSFCELVDPNGNRIVQTFDALGRVTKVVDTLGNSNVIEYDAAGRRIAETDANGHTTRFTWDEAGRLAAVREASGAVTAYTYDGNGNRLTQKDAKGNVWTFTYDALNRVVAASDPLQRKTTYTYDLLGNLTSRTDADGKTTTYTYTIGRLTGVALPDGTTEAYAYDAVGRRTSASNGSATLTYTYDAANRLRSVTNSRNAGTVAYEYDGEGNRTKMTTVRGAVSYVYDNASQLVSMTDPVFGQFRFAYDSAGRRTELRFPNGVRTSYQYDNGNRLTALATTSGAGSVLDAWSYTYDAAGNRASKTDLDGQVETYAFDEVHRLTRATYADGTMEKFTYDLVGNRTSLSTSAGTTTSYTYDAANQMLTAGGDTFTYDPRGNMIARQGTSGAMTLTYDSRNRVKTAVVPGSTETNDYSATGERVNIVSPAVEGTVRPLYDASSNPIIDYDTGNTVWVYRAYGPGMDEPLAEWRRANNQTTFLHRDGLGSVTAVSDAAGTRLYRQTFTVFGKMARSALPSGIVATRLGFTARENSVGSLMQYRSRYYDTQTGRFTSQDSYAGSAISPPSLNRYTYVNNDPVDYVDPTGHWLQFAVPFTLGVMILGMALAVKNAIIYSMYEQCPQFSDCLALVSGVVVPLALVAAALMIAKLGLFGFIIGLLVGSWLIYQNNCMFAKWQAQDSDAWRTSHQVCNSQGWSSRECCGARATGEQMGYGECINAIPIVGPAADFIFPIKARLSVAFNVFCSNCG